MTVKTNHDIVYKFNLHKAIRPKGEFFSEHIFESEHNWLAFDIKYTSEGAWEWHKQILPMRLPT
jgi:hypothetical protein